MKTRIFQKQNILNRFSLSILSIFLIFMLNSLNIVASNIIQNPGFEFGEDGKAESWTSVSRKNENSVQWIADDVHSGTKAIKLVAKVAEDQGKSFGIYTNYIPIQENYRVDLSAWIKANNILSGGQWYKGRVVLHMFDQNKNSIEHEELQFDGSISDWTKICFYKITPKDTQFLRLGFVLTSCTGTMWIDDVELTITPYPPVSYDTEMNIPVIIPSPRKVNFKHKYFSIGSLAIVIDPILGKQDYLIEEIKEFLILSEIANFKFFEPNDTNISSYSTQLLIGDLEHSTAIINQFKFKFPDSTHQDIGPQGYFLSTVEDKTQNIIYLGGKNEQGRFYGFQSFKQAIVRSSEPTAYVIDIIDAPTLETRGIAMGVQWFSKQKEAIERLAGLKGNFIVNQGSYLNYKFSINWRQEFTSNELAIMTDYLALCQKHFIVPNINFGPRSSSPDDNPVKFSSNDEIRLIVDKMKKLYDIGYRNFGLNFDDLQNVGQETLLTDEDKAEFGNNIGKAHSYFTLSVFNRLKELCHDINFCVIPMYYNINSHITDEQQTYLSAFAPLSADIKIIICTVTDNVILDFNKIIKKKLTIWDNFFPKIQSADFNNEYSWPFPNKIDWNSDNIKSAVTGFVFMPFVPDSEDTSLISWNTVSDFMWSPEQYISLNSFWKAIAKYKLAGEQILWNSPQNLEIKFSR